MQQNWIIASGAASALLARETREESRRASSYAWVILAVWLTSTVYAFWSFELKHQRSFESSRSAWFDSGARARSAESWFAASVASQAATGAAPIATVVHVYSSGCDCNRFTHPHLARIVDRYRARGVNFVAAERGAHPAPVDTGPTGELGPVGLRQVALRARDDLAWIEATPAALVFDARGKLVYFGPYSDSARCGDSGGLVERVLDRVLRGESIALQPFFGGGCFCDGDNKT